MERPLTDIPQEVVQEAELRAQQRLDSRAAQVLSDLVVVVADHASARRHRAMAAMADRDIA